MNRNDRVKCLSMEIKVTHVSLRADSLTCACARACIRWCGVSDYAYPWACKLSCCWSQPLAVMLPMGRGVNANGARVKSEPKIFLLIDDLASHSIQSIIIIMSLDWEDLMFDKGSFLLWKYSWLSFQNAYWITSHHLIGEQQLYPFLCLSHEKVTTHFTPLKWWCTVVCLKVVHLLAVPEVRHGLIARKPEAFFIQQEFEESLHISNDHATQPRNFSDTHLYWTLQELIKKPNRKEGNKYKIKKTCTRGGLALCGTFLWRCAGERWRGHVRTKSIPS